MGWRANTWESKVLTSSLVWNDKWMRLNVTTSTILIIWNSKVIFRYWMHQFLINTSADQLSVLNFQHQTFFFIRVIAVQHTSLRNSHIVQLPLLPKSGKNQQAANLFCINTNVFPSITNRTISDNLFCALLLSLGIQFSLAPISSTSLLQRVSQIWRVFILGIHW